jgi:glycerate 2-kinase
MRAGIDAASAAGALLRVLSAADRPAILSVPLHVVAAGKAAASMAATIAAAPDLTLQTIFAVGTHRHIEIPSRVEWREAAHPLPDERSVSAGQRALDIARAVPTDEALCLLLSGGASALLARPAQGIDLDDERHTIALMMQAGADIHVLNTVRKHLSAIKGGQLAAACRGATLTLALSDVVDDDVSVIGSGPGVADVTTWSDAAMALERFGGDAHPVAVRERLRAGAAGRIDDTPKPGDPRMQRAQGRVIATRRHALEGARRAAENAGYRVIILDGPVTGEARLAAVEWLSQVRSYTDVVHGPTCVLSAGETTVSVTGAGKGGRNQEFTLTLVEPFAALPHHAVVASVGTDGIDGPTDAAGALVDRTTLDRARRAKLGAPQEYLDQNDSFSFFAALGDLIRTGATDTNVGDLQIFLRAT